MLRIRGLGTLLALCGSLAAASCQMLQNDNLPVYSGSQSDVVATAPIAQSPSLPRQSGAGGLAIRPDAVLPTGTSQYGTGQMIGQSRPRRGSTSDGDIRINLAAVPIAAASKAVLGDILGLNYSVDPKLTAPVTVQTSQPVDREEAVRLFESALRSAGAVIVESGGTYRVVPADQAPASLTRINAGGRPSATQIGNGVQVVQLRYISAAEMKRVLDPMSPPGSVIRADDARNVITLQGNQNDLATMLEAVQVFDVDVMRGMTTAIVPVRTSQPDAIVEELRTIFGSDRDGPTRGVVQFVPNRRLGAILVMSPQQAYVERAKTVIARLDSHAQGQEQQLFTYSVQNRPVRDLANVLQSVFASETGNQGNSRTPNTADSQRQPAVAPRFGAQTVSPFTPQGSGSQGISGPRAPQATGNSFGPTVEQQQAEAARQAAVGGPLVSAQQAGLIDPQHDGPRIRIVADEPNNSLLIFASSRDYRRIKRVVDNLDVVPNQVLIEATIAEVTLNDDLKFGVRWYFQNRRSSFTFTDAANGAVSSVFPGFSYALRAANVQVTLDALNEITNVNVVSSPSLMVLDNRTATLQIGDQVPVATQSGVFTTGAVVNTISFKDTGVILSVTPRINESGRVLLDIEQEVSSVARTTTSGIDSPTIRQRRVKTTVVVNDGEALALGGLIQDQARQGSEQIPVLGDLPIIGNIFRQKTDGVVKTELLIMITPRVVRDQNEARRVTEEFRRSIGLYLPASRMRRPGIAENVQRVLR
jgi:general secretion pathway protein D